MGNKGASELWGLDISSEQIKTAKDFLKGNGYEPNLFVSPMEENPGIPLKHFDIVYSIYALGWTVDIEKTINLVSSYLKRGIRKKQPMVLHNWKMSSYINVLASCGMKVEQLHEDIKSDIKENGDEFSEKYYSAYKANLMPLSFIVKAVKL